MQRRKVTYALYPNCKMNLQLFELLRLHKDLWNGALEERISAYEKTGKGRSYQEQTKAFTQVRAECPEYAAINCSSGQVTLRRLSHAMNAFFRRVKAGQSPGFPRFKSLARMSSIGFKNHGDGWRFTPDKKWKHGRLYLSGIGFIKARGRARQGGLIKSCEILEKKGKWFLSLTLECKDIKRECTGNGLAAADWGVNTLLTLATLNAEGEETCEQVPNSRWYQMSKELRTQLAQEVSRKKRGSRAWRKACKKVGNLSSLIARKRHDEQHKLSAKIAKNVLVFATEELSIKNMTASAAGTVEEPGSNVQQKAGLNREILDTAPAALFQKISYKVHETGGWFLEAPTRQLKPSQTCPNCKAVKKKSLAERQHECECGYVADRDYAAARVVLFWMMDYLRGLGTSPIGDLSPETAVLA